MVEIQDQDSNPQNNKLNLDKLNLCSSLEDTNSKFTLGSFYFKVSDFVINDTKYGELGSTIDLEAQIPTFTNTSNHPLPEAEELELGIEEIFQWLVKHNVVRSKGKTVGETRSKIRGLLVQVYIGCNGKFRVTDPIVITSTSAIVLTVIVDDIVEKLQVFELDGKIGKVIVQAFKSILEPKSTDEAFNFEGLGSIPALEPALSAFIELKERQNELMGQMLMSENGNQSHLTYLSSVLYMQREKGEIYNIPEETFLFIRAQDSGASLPLTSVTKMQNLYLSEDVRISVLHQRFEQVFCYIVAELNDLVGIKRDLMDPDGPGIGLVFYYINNQNLNLVQAWEKAKDKLDSHAKEIIFLVNKIIESNPDEEGLEEYYETGLRMLDLVGYHSFVYLADRYQIEK